MRKFSVPETSTRRGAVLIFAAIILVMLFAFVAFSVDVGYMTVAKGQLQNAADAAAMAGVRELGNGEVAVKDVAKAIALENQAAGDPVSLVDSDIELGEFNFASKEFTPSNTAANAVKVTTRVTDKPLFFAPIIQNYDFDMSAESIAMLNPRDIVFVVDLSGSMNDDTEPVWATQTINAKFGPLGYADVGVPLIQALFEDFGYGTYPGNLEYLGLPLGVEQSAYAFAEMTKDDGPLADPAINPWYRIEVADDELTRRVKSYRWVIDNQIGRMMPGVQPVPDSHTTFDYWAGYLDFIISGAWVGPPPPPPGEGTGEETGPGPGDPSPTTGYLGPMPSLRESFGVTNLSQRSRNRTLGTVAGITSAVAVELLAVSGAPGQASDGRGVPRQGRNDYTYVPRKINWDAMYSLNNPNYYTYPDSTVNIWDYANHIGFLTYVQYMLDWGRDRSPQYATYMNADPDLAAYTPLSLRSSYCPLHTEATAGGTFQFPPREQPMHSVRRAMIAAIQQVKSMNSTISNDYGDRIGIVTYDGLDAYHAPEVVQPLTSNFNTAMQACTRLQATSDIGSTTATEAGLITAYNHLKTPDHGGAGRPFASRVIVLLTDGSPNAWTSPASDIDSYTASNSSSDYYDSVYVWYNSALVQAARSESRRVSMYPIGMGLGTDYDFMDRMARLAGTDNGGMSVRGSGNPAEYEQRLTDIFKEIVKYPGGRLVD
ncbi:MAG: VWA domain-containing protein [Planctomycetaceae bacterium]